MSAMQGGWEVRWEVGPSKPRLLMVGKRNYEKETKSENVPGSVRTAMPWEWVPPGKVREAGADWRKSLGALNKFMSMTGPPD